MSERKSEIELEHRLTTIEDLQRNNEIEIHNNNEQVKELTEQMNKLQKTVSKLTIYPFLVSVLLFFLGWAFGLRMN
jgi:mevalonate kinase